MIHPKLRGLGETEPGSYAETADYFEIYLDYSDKNSEPIDDRDQVTQAIQSIRNYLKNQ